MKVLAFDVSGSATGWAFGVNHTLKDYGKFISNLKKPRGERLYAFAEWLETVLLKYEPDVVVIEKPYLGRNSNVLASLSRFIAVVELMTFQTLDLAIEADWFLDPKRIKRLVGVPRAKKNGRSRSKYSDNKKMMVKHINSLYGLKLKYTNGKSKRHNDDDIADAIAVWAAWLKISDYDD